MRLYLDETWSRCVRQAGFQTQHHVAKRSKGSAGRPPGTQPSLHGFLQLAHEQNGSLPSLRPNTGGLPSNAFITPPFQLHFDTGARSYKLVRPSTNQWVWCGQANVHCELQAQRELGKFYVAYATGARIDCDLLMQAGDQTPRVPSLSAVPPVADVTRTHAGVPRPQCTICMDDLICRQNPRPVEALLCGHTFHTECLEALLEARHCTRFEACPYRCHQSTPAVALAAGTSAPPQGPIQDVAEGIRSAVGAARANRDQALRDAEGEPAAPAAATHDVEDDDGADGPGV